jgi:hypothetical protein
MLGTKSSLLHSFQVQLDRYLLGSLNDGKQLFLEPIFHGFPIQALRVDDNPQR